MDKVSSLVEGANKRAAEAKELVEGGMGIIEACKKAGVGYNSYKIRYGKKSKAPEIRIFGEQNAEKPKYTKKKTAQSTAPHMILVGYTLEETKELLPR